MAASSSKIGDYNINHTKKLGAGAFGTVYKGQNKNTKEHVAVKKCSLTNPDDIAIVMQEIQGLRHVPEHENIIKLYGFHFHDDSAWIVMEFCESGDLVDYCKSSKGLDLDEMIHIMLQSTQGVIHMHTLKEPLAHRDLKPQNILFKREKGGKMVAKIGDFGLAKVVNNYTKMKTVAGTLLYMAPELLLEEAYDLSVDIYSLGLVFLSMLLYDAIGELIPLSVTAINKGEIKPIGVEMIKSRVANTPPPVVTIPSDRDDIKERTIKKIINDMVEFNGEDRLSLKRVHSELQDLLSIKASCSRFSTSSSTATSVKGPLLLEMMKKEALKQTVIDTTSMTSSPPYGEPSVHMGELMTALRIREGLKPVESRELKFKVGERVILDPKKERVMTLQKGHGGWVQEMELYLGKDGWVKGIESRNVVTVKFDDGYKYAFNVDLLKKYSGPPKPLGIHSFDIKAGDMVRLIDDPKVLVAKQKNVKWETNMILAKGMGGVVHKVLHSGIVVVECFNGDIWPLHPDVLLKRNVSDQQKGKGDLVKFTSSRELMIKAMEKEGLKWDDKLDNVLGTTGKVMEVINPRVVKAKAKSVAAYFPVSALALFGKQSEINKAVTMKSVITDMVS